MTPALTATGLRLQIRDRGGTTDVEVFLTADDISLAEVFESLGLGESTLVDGHRFSNPATTPALDALVSGAELRPPGVRSDVDLAAPRDGVVVASVAGLDAGASVDLGAGLYRLNEAGPEPDRGWYLRVEPSLPAGSTGQPWHESAPSIEAFESDGGVLALGDSVKPESGHSRAVHRPPRALPANDVAAIELPPAPPSVSPPSPLSWATLLAPVPIAVLMAFFFRPIFALFAAMGPIMALGRWYESRRRHRKASHERRREIAAIQHRLGIAAKLQSEDLARLRWLRHPHVAELWRRARTNSVRLWERRRGGPDFLTVAVGVGPDRVNARIAGDIDPEVHAVIDRPIAVRSVPHTIDLATNTGVGVHGDREGTLSVARALVLQLATLHGPADLTIGVVCSAQRCQDWDWLKWLPHAERRLSGHSARAVAKEIAAAEDPTPQRNNRAGDTTIDGLVRLIVVDDASADVAAISRAAKSAGVATRVVAVATDPTHIPAACSTIIAVHGSAAAELASPELTGRRTPMCPIGVSAPTAVAWARALTGLVDPEVDDMPADRASAVGLLRLLGFSTADELAERWRSRAGDAPPVATLGVSDDGVMRIDLTADGPHALVAGTTGSGKSELLRTIVLSLAAQCAPEQLNFVLVDFKGGGAFDSVRRLPHVAGLITDLDAALVERAVNSLRVELQRREMLFRELGASEYDDATRRARDPIARLVVVIDEFAALATDYGDLMASIIDLASRGRSLGMHLILATQRPSGVVDQKIRANTNLRIALRVQDAFDSQDVIGVADAASIHRSSPGRAMVRVGGDPVVTLQTAFSGGVDSRSARCVVRPHLLFDAGEGPTSGSGSADALTEIEVLVDAIVAAGAASGPGARRLWSDPLPTSLGWIDLAAQALATEADDRDRPGFVLGLADEPDRQMQVPWRWDPDSGGLAIYGASASCTGKSLRSLGAAISATSTLDDAHLYIIDGDAGATRSLAGVGHVGAYVTLGELDRISRTVGLFEDRLEQRRSHGKRAESPRLILFVDNLAAVVGAFDELAGAALIDRLAALARDGSPQGLHLVVTARTGRDIGHRLGQQIPNRLVFDLSDPGGFLTLGLRASDVVALPPMRAIDVATRRLVQIVEPPEDGPWDAGHNSHPGPAPVRAFPVELDADDLTAPRCQDDGTLVIPVGVGAVDLDEVALRLRPGDHALVLAAPGMGASATVLMVARQLVKVPGLRTVQVTTHRSGLRTRPAGEAEMLEARDTSETVETVETADELRRVVEAEHDTVIIVDDADLLDADMVEVLTAVLACRGNCRVIAAGALESSRSIRAWTTPIRTAGTGIVLGGTAADGELFKARFSRLDGLGTIPGRGHLIVRGQAVPAQIARANAPR